MFSNIPLVTIVILKSFPCLELKIWMSIRVSGTNGLQSQSVLRKIMFVIMDSAKNL